MWAIEIVDVDIDQTIPGLTLGIDAPKPGQICHHLRVRFSGWAIGDPDPVGTVHIGWDFDKAFLPIVVHRPDIAQAYPGKPGVERAGFVHEVALGHVSAGPLEFEISLATESSLTRVATVRAVVRQDKPEFSPSLLPLVVTSLGRTGTTLALQGLLEHPEIITTPTFPYEVRMAKHFMKVLHRSISIDESVLLPDWVEERFTPGHVSSSVRHVLECIESYYQTTAQVMARPNARYFAEKHTPFSGEAWLLDLYEGAREIFLVRDFRDMLTSTLAFNERRGVVTFGRESFETDEDYARVLPGVRELHEAWRRRGSSGLVVRYEDLITQPERVWADVFQYLGVDDSPETIAAVVARANSRSEAELSHTTSESVARSVSRWRRELAPELAATVTENFGYALSDFGYDLE